jgi:hypothetical protein
MIETACLLVLAHTLCDFDLRTHRMVRNKHRTPVLALHGAMIYALSAGLLGLLGSAWILTLALAHVAIDAAVSMLQPGLLRSAHEPKPPRLLRLRRSSVPRFAPSGAGASPWPHL